MTIVRLALNQLETMNTLNKKFFIIWHCMFVKMKIMVTQGKSTKFETFAKCQL